MKEKFKVVAINKEDIRRGKVETLFSVANENPDGAKTLIDEFIGKERATPSRVSAERAVLLSQAIRKRIEGGSTEEEIEALSEEAKRLWNLMGGL